MSGISTYAARTRTAVLDRSIDGQSSFVAGVLPFVKWAGGKRRLLPEILEAAPSSFSRYLEPFLGGGAVALTVQGCPMLLNDSNEELITAYRMVRECLGELCILLDSHRSAHSEDYFYQVRQQNVINLSPIETAARFIYLNKTAFNGLYRVNRNDQFNVPHGRYKNPVLYDRTNLVAVSRVLQKADLSKLDFREFLIKNARPGDFIYLDPVYHPVSKFSDFKRYTPIQFRDEDQIALASLYDELAKLGAYPVLSNSYCEFTLNLYAAHNIRVVEATRNINHDGKGRGRISEILVTPKG